MAYHRYLTIVILMTSIAFAIPNPHDSIKQKLLEKVRLFILFIDFLFLF